MMSSDPGSAKVDLTSQVAVVTGGGRGLGHGFAQALAAAGAAVAVTARTESELGETVKSIQDAGGTAIAFRADVTDHAGMAGVFAEVERHFGPVDILVNNAAVVTPLGYDWEVDPDEWWRTLEINLRGPFLCTKLILPGMMERRRGRIVNVSSIAAHTVHPYGTAYCASKAGLTHMTNLIAAAVKDYGISVFALSPGAATAMGETLASSPRVPEPMRSQFRSNMDAGVGMDESVRMFMFLVSGRADTLTGRHINFWIPIEDLVSRSDDIVKNDLYTLRLRE